MQPNHAATHSSSLVIGISIIAAIAGLLFGYDVGVISDAIIFIKQAFGLTPTQEGVLVSAVPFGALVAAALCGKWNDILGRRNNLLITAILFMVGTLGCTFATNIGMLLVSRLIVGIAIGIGSFSAPLYISEVAGENHRGALVTLNQLAIVIGIFSAYLVNYLFAKQGDWRWMFGCGLIPAVLLFIMALYLPESPRWLMSRGFVERAQAILTRIHGQQKADTELLALQQVISLEHSTTSSHIKLPKNFWRVLVLGILVSILTQAVGINAIIYYAPTIFQLTGFNQQSSATLATLGVGAVNVIFTLVAIRFLDAFGRRSLLLIGISGIVISLVIMVLSFAGNLDSSMTLAWLTFGAIILFIACQAIGTGPACWLIPSEIFPTNSRGLGMGFSVAFNWGTNVVVAFLFPVILANWGAATSFAVFLAIAIIAWLYFYFFLPETKNVSLEQIEKNLFAGKKTRDLGA